MDSLRYDRHCPKCFTNTVVDLSRQPDKIDVATSIVLMEDEASLEKLNKLFSVTSVPLSLGSVGV